MNEYLAELYGTDEIVKQASQETAEEVTEQDLEKEAADAFVEAATENGIDLNSLEDSQVEELYVPFHNEFMKTAAEAMEEGEELEEKLAEADYMGRVMAHSYVNELNEIEKEAKGGKLVGKIKGVGGKIKDVGKSYVGTMKGKGVSAAERKVKRVKGGRGYKARLAEAKKGVTKAKVVRGLAIGGTGAAGAGALGGIAGGGYAAGRSKKAADEEYAAIIEERALEMLKEAGYDVEDNEEEKLAEQVERDALTLLEENGFSVEWAE